MRLLMITAFLSAFIVQAAGQGSFTIKDFLANARMQESVAYQQKKFSFLNNISHELSLIEKLEVRTETNEFDFRKQEYLLRVSPNSFKSIETQRQYQETNRFMAESELKTELGTALLERYDLLVKYVYSQKLLKTKQKQKVLFSDRVTLFKRSVTLAGFDILELIEAEDEEQEAIREILDLENMGRTVEKEMQLKMKTADNVEMEGAKWVDMNDVKNLMASFKSAEPAGHYELDLLSAKVYKSMMEYEREVAKNKFSLGYIQTKYGYDSNDNFGKSFSIGVGFDIPLKGAARLDLNELQISTFELERRFFSLKNSLLAQQNALSQELENLLLKYDLVNEQLNDSQAEYALKEYRKIAEASPKALLKMRENTLKKEWIQQKLEFEIMLAFVEFLDVSGLMSKQPFENYLSKGREQF